MKKNASTILLPSNASAASKYGISKQNRGGSVLGLNPNLNIEDEYVQNLLKQIHFMNMEVKLLKEKQQQSSNNGLWSIINRANEPLVKNIVDSNQKYQEMKRKVDGDLNQVEYENIVLADQQNAVLHKYNHLDDKTKELEAAKSLYKLAFLSSQSMLMVSVSQLEAKMTALSEEKTLQQKRNTELLEQYESILLDAQRDKSNQQYDLAKIKIEEVIEELLLNQKKKASEQLRTKIDTMKANMEANIDYQKSKEEQEKLREQICLFNSKMAAAEFELLQTEQAIKLAEKEKQRETVNRKKLTEECESLKIMLKEIIQLNDARKEQQGKNRIRESQDIHKGEYQTRKIQKNLEETKKKLAKTEDAARVIKIEVDCLERELANVTLSRQTVGAALSKISARNQEKDTVLIPLRSELRKLNDISDRTIASQFNAQCQLNELEKQIVSLRARHSFFEQNVNLKQLLNETKLQQLQKVVQKNKDVNETVEVLMQKWEQIKQFSKI